MFSIGSDITKSHHCTSTCMPLDYTCNAVDMEAEITYAENVICATSETPKDQYCTCRAFWTGDDCNEGFLFYYPTAGMFYAVFFTIVFFGLFVFAAYGVKRVPRLPVAMARPIALSNE